MRRLKTRRPSPLRLLGTRRLIPLKTRRLHLPRPRLTHGLYVFHARNPPANPQRAGIHPAVVERLLQAHPDAVGPTPSQRAFLLAAMRGKADVWFKDYMGRGK